MKHFNLRSLKQLLLSLIAIVGISFPSYGQDTQEVFFYDLTSDNSNYTEAVKNIPLYVNDPAMYSFKNSWNQISEVSTKKYTFTFTKSSAKVENEYFSIKANLTNGKYKLSVRAGNYYDPAGEKFKFFYTENDPQTAEKTFVSDSFYPQKVGAGTSTFFSNEFEITNAEGGKDFYLGVTFAEVGTYGPEVQFADIKLVRITDEVIPENEYMITWADPIPNGSLEIVYANEPTQTVDNGDMVTEGTELKIIPHADENYELTELSYTISGQEAVSFNIGEEPYTFIAKDGVEDPRAGYFAIINATFSKKQSPTLTYNPITVSSGFNTDVIAEARPSSEHTTGTLDTQGWVLFTSDIQEEGSLPLELTTNENIPYKMADVTSNNAAVLKGTNTESTLVFKYPAKAEEVRLLSISAEGASTMEVIVNYDDDTNITKSFTIADWWNSYKGQGEAYYGLDRIITESTSPYSKDQLDGRKQFRLFEQVVNTDPEKMIVSVRVVNKSTGTTTPTVLGVTVFGEIIEVEPVMPSITVKKPVNGNLVISYTVNDEMQSIETYNFENDSEVFSIPEGTLLSISANPEFDYELDQILPEGMVEKTGKAGDKYYEYTVTRDATIEATFKPIQYGKVSAETPEEGTIEIQVKDPMRGSWGTADEFFLEQVEFGTELRAKVEAKTGYNLVSVMKNQEELSTEEEGYYYFTVDAEEITISAEFEAKAFTLTKEVTPAEGGSVSVKFENGEEAAETVKFGDIITVTAEANKGYLLESIKVTGADEIDGQSGKYQVTGDVTVTVAFKIDESSISNVENAAVYYNGKEEILYTDGAKSVKVYDLSGRLVLDAENQENVSLAELTEGIYTVVVDNTVLKLRK